MSSEVPHAAPAIPADSESLRNELIAAQAAIAELQRELKSIHDSPAWKLITHYRKWLGSGRGTAMVRFVDGLARFGINGLSGTGPVSRAPGKLIQCQDPACGDKIFYADNGRRHWVPNGGHLDDYGLSLSQVTRVSATEMQEYELAGPLPRMWPRSAWLNPPRTSATTMREVATCRLQGSGIEFGAAGNPMPAPIRCQVKFADLFPEEDQRSRAYPGQGTEFVRISRLMSMDDMSAVPEASLDFVIACHVIEHTRNPLGAFEQVYRKLKRGGQYVLVVPDRRLTFDKDRELTTLDHLILDYQEPSAERDVPHYTEFSRMVKMVPEAVLDQYVRDAIASRLDIHFHTWTYESFLAMVDHSRRHMTPWRSVWSQPSVDADPWAIEFYFVLEK